MPRAKVTVTLEFEYELAEPELYPEGATDEERLAVDLEQFEAEGDLYRTAEILEALAEDYHIRIEGALIPESET